MMYIALYKVSIHTNILNVLCISTKSMKTVFTYSNRTFTDVAKLFPYVTGLNRNKIVGAFVFNTVNGFT